MPEKTGQQLYSSRNAGIQRELNVIDEVRHIHTSEVLLYWEARGTFPQPNATTSPKLINFNVKVESLEQNV